MTEPYSMYKRRMETIEENIKMLEQDNDKLREKDDYNLSMLAKLQRDYSHLLKQKKDCEESKYKLKEDIENGTSHLERLLFKYDKVREEWGQLKYTLDEIKELDLSKVKRFTGTNTGDSNEEHNEIVNTLQRILTKHEDKK